MVVRPDLDARGASRIPGGNDPPAAQQMLLQGIKTLVGNAKGKMPANLAQRVSFVTAVEQLVGLLAAIWPADAEDAREED